MIDEHWLISINEEFRRKNITPQRRPFEAIGKYSQEKGISVALNSSEAQQICSWFEKNSKPGIHAIGSLYESCYYFDATFWKVSIPIGYGTFQLQALDAISDMPKSIKESMMSNRSSALDYIVFWSDCVDFGYGYDDLVKMNREDKLGLDLLKASYQELQSAKSMLLEHRVNERAMMSSRMATEMISKSFIAMKVGLSEKEAKKLGHDLRNCFDRFVQVAGYNMLKKLTALISIFPSIDERYERQTHSNKDLWLAYGFAHTLAAYLTREFTDRNIQSQVLSSNKPSNTEAG